MEYRKASEAARRWDTTAYFIIRLCELGCIPEAVKNGRVWYIPEDAAYPLQGYAPAPEMAAKWNIARGNLWQACKEGRVPGAKRIGRDWYIPADAQKPVHKATERKEGCISAARAAEKWGISQGAVCAAAREGRIPGAECINSKWHIPEDAQRPKNKAAERKSGYISAKKAAEKWGITPTAVCIAAKEGRVLGAEYIGGKWHIPENAQMPTNKITDRKAGFISATKAAEKWETTRSFVCKLCREGRVPGAEQIDGVWHIPQGAAFPVKRREKRKN